MNETPEARRPARKRAAPRQNFRQPVTLGSKVRYPLRDAATLLGISLRMLYQRIREGKLPTVSDGRRRFVSDADIREYGSRSH